MAPGHVRVLRGVWKNATGGVIPDTPILQPQSYQTHYRGKRKVHVKSVSPPIGYYTRRLIELQHVVELNQGTREPSV